MDKKAKVILFDTVCGKDDHEDGDVYEEIKI